MAQNQPKKVGKYNRPMGSSKTSAIVIGVIVLIILIILAIIIF
jgi:hypothetical protein